MPLNWMPSFSRAESKFRCIQAPRRQLAWKGLAKFSLLMRRNLARVFSTPSLPSAIKQLLRAEDADLPSVISFQKIKKKKILLYSENRTLSLACESIQWWPSGRSFRWLHPVAQATDMGYIAGRGKKTYKRPHLQTWLIKWARLMSSDSV